ncbi:MAG: hypothetical protein DWQ33_00920 [Bacteroidetes bacterium]|nr:MAG: hypothetical protein DWQ33_00920 [Bacteroidota bacterium]
MYHCIQLRRILESIELLRNYEFAHHRDLICLMESKAGIMCGWLLQMAFDNGELPQVNDSSSDMPNWLGLFQYAERLGIKTRLQHLGPSGFRKFRNRNFELLVDVNGLNPALAPGHSHADTFSFILNVFGEPFIVDTGVSTYERGADRDYERSTLAHNTVIVAGKNQSEVYDSFRVGFKNKVFGLKENRNFVSASHDGYKSIGAIHSRSFEIKDREIIIRDIVDNVNSQSCIASFHVHKNSPLQQSGNGIIHKFVQISFEGADSVQLSDTKISPAFGVKVPAKKVLVGFSGELITRISLP